MSGDATVTFSVIGDTGELPQEFMRIYTQPDDEENDRAAA